MDIEPGELTVGQLAQRSGVAISALHFYERQSLIISRRTAGNQRRYKRDTLRRVALIRIAQPLHQNAQRSRETTCQQCGQDPARLRRGQRLFELALQPAEGHPQPPQ